MKMRTVRLVRRHRHVGTVHEAGAQLVIEERIAAWLIAQGVAEAVGGARPVVPEMTAPAVAAEVDAAPVARLLSTPRPTGCCGNRW